MNFVWTQHVEERQKQWERLRKVTRARVERVLREPEQVVRGYHGASVAQSRFGGGLLRVSFMIVDEGYKVLTVYWTSKVSSYWEVK